MFTRYDKFLICFLLLVALFSFIGGAYYIEVAAKEPTRGEATRVTISVGGKAVGSYRLKDGPEKIKVKGSLGPGVVEISRGRVRMSSCSCPQKLCVAQGWIRKPGEVIVCVPNKIIVKIVGSLDSSIIDAISK